MIKIQYIELSYNIIRLGIDHYNQAYLHLEIHVAGSSFQCQTSDFSLIVVINTNQNASAKPD